jgi:hypothetical protein
MLPVNYEIHCAACHPLTFDQNVKGPDGQPVNIPHNLQPAEVKDFVWGAYAAAYAGKGLDQRIAEALKEGPKPSRPLPGKLTEAEKAARDTLDKQTLEADKFLFKDDVRRTDLYIYSGKTTCGECHVYDKAGETKRILPLQVNNVWLTHAKFSHVAHRAADCRVCHPNAYAFDADGKSLNPKASVDQREVLIAGIENCRQCHTPAAGVRSDCTECHMYHHGDRPLQALGAAARNPGGKDDPRRFKDAARFLQGVRD